MQPLLSGKKRNSHVNLKSSPCALQAVRDYGLWQDPVLTPPGQNDLGHSDLALSVCLFFHLFSLCYLQPYFDRNIPSTQDTVFVFGTHIPLVNQCQTRSMLIPL